MSQAYHLARALHQRQHQMHPPEGLRAIADEIITGLNDTKQGLEQ